MFCEATSIPTLFSCRNPSREASRARDFLALWKDADPSIPILRQTKFEYAKVQ